MEQLIHYCWKHKIFPPKQMKTTDGREIEVIDPGLHNHNAGPDFFNSKVKIDNQLWIGNVEIHDKASDWFMHKHNLDSNYDNVVLHVCSICDQQALTKSGNAVPQVELEIPEYVQTNYQLLLKEDKYPPCHKIIPSLSTLKMHSWMSALQTERLEGKTLQIAERVRHHGGDWEKTLFITLARNFGFGINGDAFELWAETVDLNAAAHHRDNEFQVEAIFMGQAGFLSLENLPQRQREKAQTDAYFIRLQSEYKYLKHKFGLKEMDNSRWRFLRLRPQNFPYIRISQLVSLYCKRKSQLSNICEATTLKQLSELLQTKATPYWQQHYTFGNETSKSEKKLSASSVELIIINTIAPMLFAYGRSKSDEKLTDRSFFFLEQLRSEENNVVRLWRECGMTVSNAGDSQALLQLKRNYCERRDCLRCRIGYEYLRIR